MSLTFFLRFHIAEWKCIYARDDISWPNWTNTSSRYVRSLEDRVAELEALLTRDQPQQQPQVTLIPSPVAHHQVSSLSPLMQSSLNSQTRRANCSAERHAFELITCISAQSLPSHLQYAYQNNASTASSVGSSIHSEMANLSTNIALSSLGFGSAVDISMTGIGLSSANLNYNLQPHFKPAQEDSGLDPDLDMDVQQQLMDAYFDMAHSQFPLLLKHQFLQWAETWNSRKETLPPSMRWKGFFVYMVRIGILKKVRELEMNSY